MNQPPTKESNQKSEKQEQRVHPKDMKVDANNKKDAENRIELEPKKAHEGVSVEKNKKEALDSITTSTPEKVKSDATIKTPAIPAEQEIPNVPAPVQNVPAPAQNVPAPVQNVPAPAQNAPAPAQNVPAPVGNMAPGSAGMVEMGGGLPALPPRPVAPIRQAMPSASASGFNNALPQRVPNLKQVSKPQFNIPPGSDLGVVGKIGVYQMSHKSSATDIHANLFFWVYIVTLITTYFLIKKK